MTEAARIEVAQTAAAFAALHAESFTLERPWSEAEFATLMADPLVFAVSAQEDAAGFALGRAVAGEAELLTLAVRPGARRMGHGHALLSAFETEARRRGAREAFLEVRDDNAAARALYARAGYAERGRRRGYYAGPDGARRDALVLGRALD